MAVPSAVQGSLQEPRRPRRRSREGLDGVNVSTSAAKFAKAALVVDGLLGSVDNQAVEDRSGADAYERRKTVKDFMFGIRNLVQTILAFRKTGSVHGILCLDVPSGLHHIDGFTYRAEWKYATPSNRVSILDARRGRVSI